MGILRPDGDEDVTPASLRESPSPPVNDPTPLDRVGRSPLHYAALAGDVALVTQLLADGLDPALPDKAGYTPLHFAAQGPHAAIISLLLGAGAPVDPTDEHGNTPLWRAVMCTRDDGGAIEALLAGGADPQVENHHGISPRSLSRTIANRDVARFIPD